MRQMKLSIWCLLCLGWAIAFADDTSAEFHDRSGVKVVRSEVYSPKLLLDRQKRIRALLRDVTLNLQSASAAAGNIQGMSQRATSFSLEGSYTPLVPTSDSSSSSTVTTFDDKGNVISIERTDGAGSERSRSTSPIPAGAGVSLHSPGVPNLSLSSQDLLDAQLELETYKTVLSYAGTGHSYEGRQYVLASFEIDVQPHTRHKNKAVEILFNIVPDQKQKNAPQLEQHFPARKTYNVVEIVEDTSNIGLGIVLWPISIGGRGTDSEKTAYVVQDYEVESFGGDVNSFGWRLRPVLGDEYVRPGKRTFFALLSVKPTLTEDVPQEDTKNDQPSKTAKIRNPGTSGSFVIPQGLKFGYTTRWVRLDKRTGVLRENSVSDLSAGPIELENPLGGANDLSPNLIERASQGGLISVSEDEQQVYVVCDNVGQFPEVFVGGKSVGDVAVFSLSDNAALTAADEADERALYRNLRVLMFSAHPKYLNANAALTVVTEWGSDTKTLSKIFGSSAFDPPPSPKVASVELMSKSPGKAVIRVDGKGLEEKTRVAVGGESFQAGDKGFDRVGSSLIIIDLEVQNSSGKPDTFTSSKVEVFTSKGERIWSRVLK